jgi:hypothetical protein
MGFARRLLGVGAGVLGLGIAAEAYVPPSGTYQFSGVEVVTARARGRVQRTLVASAFTLTVNGTVASFESQPDPWTVTVSGALEEKGRNRFRMAVDDDSVLDLEGSLRSQLEASLGQGNVEDVVVSFPRIRGVLPRSGALRLRLLLRVRAEVSSSGIPFVVRVKDRGVYTVAP